MKLATALAFVALAAAPLLAGDDDPEPASVEVRVEVVADDAREEPVAGARVAVHDGAEEFAVGRTGADGTATLLLTAPLERLARAMAAETLTIEASGAGRGLRAQTFRPALRGEVRNGARAVHPTPEAISLPPGAPVAGRVVDFDSGEPIAGALVCVDQQPERRSRRPGTPKGLARTDAEGGFSFEGVSRSGGNDPQTSLTVSAPGHVAVRRSVPVAAGIAAQVFHLERAGEVRGRVTGSDGNPMPGQRVDLRDAMVWSPDGDRPTYASVPDTDDSGAFAFAGVAFGVRHSVSARPSGGPLREGDDETVFGILVTPSRPVADVDLRVGLPTASRAATLEVAVAPQLPQMRLVGVSGRLEHAEGWTAAAASGNPLVFRGAPAGRYRLWISVRGVPQWSGDVEIEAGDEPTSLRVAIGGRETLAGHVVDDMGAPVQWMDVRWLTADRDVWSDGAVVTDAEGAFRFDGLTRGRYVLHAKGLLHGAAESPVTAPSTDVEIVMPRTGGIRAKLGAVPGGATPPSQIWSDDADFVLTDGALTALNVPVGRRTVEARDERSQPAFLPLRFVVVVKPGEWTDVGTVDLDAGATVTGRVLDAAGRPAESASVTWGARTVWTDALGRFTLTVLPRERLVLVAGRAGERADAAVDAASPPEDLTIRLVRTRLVRVETRGARSVWLDIRATRRERADVASPALPAAGPSDTSWVDSRGTVFLRLLPGEWTLSASVRGSESSLATADVTVPATGDGPIRVDLPVK